MAKTKKVSTNPTFSTKQIYHLTMNDPPSFPVRHLIEITGQVFLLRVEKDDRLCVSLELVDVK